MAMADADAWNDRSRADDGAVRADWRRKEVGGAALAMKWGNMCPKWGRGSLEVNKWGPSLGILFFLVPNTAGTGFPRQCGDPVARDRANPEPSKSRIDEDGKRGAGDPVATVSAGSPFCRCNTGTV